jgi:heptosyltransferase-2
MSLPALAALRTHFATATLVAAPPDGLAPLFGAVPFIDEVLALPPATGWLGWRRHANAIRAGRFDLAVLFPNSFQAAWVARRAGVPERWGYRADGRGWLLTKRVDRPRSKGVPLHQAQYYRQLLVGLGIEVEESDPRLVAPPNTRARARALLQAHGCDVSRAPVIAIAPGSAHGHARRWLPKRFAELIASLTREAGAHVALVGSAHDRDAGYAIESSLASAGAREAADRLINLIGRIDLRTLIGVLSWCRSAVSNDSGAVHLASALGLPVTVIFGPTDERRTAPVGRHEAVVHDVWCRPCSFRDCPIDHRCMKGISTEMVLDAVRRQLYVPCPSPARRS